MNAIEIALVVCACLIPLVVFVMMFPKALKFKRKPKKEQPKAEPAKEVKAEEPPKVQEKAEKAERPTFTQYDPSDFTSYLKEKSKKTTKPTFKPTDDKLEFLPNYNEFFNPKPKEKEKPIRQQLDELSPEMKVLLISGVLDKKY